jgi:acyl-CoA thioesterase
MEVLDYVAPDALVEKGLIDCRALARVFDGETVLAESTKAVTTVWPEPNGSLLIPEADVRLDLLLEAGTGEGGEILFTLTEGGEPVAWRDARSAPGGGALIGFHRKHLRIELQDRRPGHENGVSTVDRFPRWGDITDLIDLMDVRQQPDGSFQAPPFGTVRRNVVEGGQLLGDTIVAAAKTDPSKRIISAQTVFSRPGLFNEPLRIDVHKSRMGRSFTTLTVETTQNGKPIATGLVLLDAGVPDLMRHHVDAPDVPGPMEAHPYDFGLIGRELRIVNGDYSPDPDRIGPPEIHSWMRHRIQPDQLYLRQAILAQPTTHWTIAASMLPHNGYGEVMAHRTISTGVLSSTIYFHEDPDLTEWILYSTRATHAGNGLAQGEGRIFSQSGKLLATYSVQVMVRALEVPEGDAGMKDDRLM